MVVFFKLNLVRGTCINNALTLDLLVHLYTYTVNIVP